MLNFDNCHWTEIENSSDFLFFFQEFYARSFILKDMHHYTLGYYSIVAEIHLLLQNSSHWTEVATEPIVLNYYVKISILAICCTTKSKQRSPLILQNLSIFWYPCLNAQIFNKVGHFGNFVINESQSWPTNFDWPELFYSEEFRSSVCSSEKSLEWPLIRCIIWSEI